MNHNSVENHNETVKEKKPPRAVNRPMERVGTWCGGFMLFGFVAYFLKQCIKWEGILPMLITVLAIGVLVAYFVARRRMPRLRVLWNVIAVGAAVYTVTFAAMCVMIVAFRMQSIAPADAPDDAVVWVFGAKINGTEPSKTLKKRLDVAADILRSHPDAVCVVSGGQGKDEMISEGGAMRRYLRGCGIDESRIFCEDQARNTVENIRFSDEITTKNGLSERPIVCVSTDFHLPRICWNMRRNGVDAFYAASRPSDPFMLYTSLVREYMSYWNTLIGNPVA